MDEKLGEAVWECLDLGEVAHISKSARPSWLGGNVATTDFVLPGPLPPAGSWLCSHVHKKVEREYAWEVERADMHNRK